jgi:hypothetical protein
MTILKETHKLCQIIQSLPIREENKQVFSALRASGREVSLGGRAHIICRQILGYLIANQELDQSTNNQTLNSDIDLLSTEELNALEEAHKILLTTYEHICPLDDLLVPNLRNSVNPYSDYNYNLVNPTSANIGSEDMEKALNSLRTEFKNHPSVSIINNYVNDCSSGISLDINPEVIYYRKQIIQYALFCLPRNLEMELFTLSLGRLRRALIVLRDSIFNVNQCLFQAIRDEKPTVLNKDNVFAYQGMNQNWLGKVTYLNVQPINQELYLHPGEIVLVDLDLEEPKKGFYRIHQMNISDSSDFGLVINFCLLSVDENMICYPDLLA